jgi:5-methylcytosine-specific restriction endonuclease McrA
VARGAAIRKLRPLVLERDGHRCVYCGKQPEDEVFLVMDHVVPAARGGADVVENLVTACDDCNSRKGAKSVWRFLSERLAA